MRQKLLNYVYGIGAPIFDSQKEQLQQFLLSGTQRNTINVKTIPMLAEENTKQLE